jgi:membrane fusion protein (multidrug efflux system)
MTTKKKQIFFAISLSLIVVVFLGFIKGCQIYQAIHADHSQPPEAVTSTIAAQSTWKRTLSSVGSVESPLGAMLSVEAAGRVGQINFESGQAVEAGAVLLELDSLVEKANLVSAQATRDEARRSFDRAKKLRASNTIPISEYDEAFAKVQAAEANVQSLEATLKRRSVVAHHAGLLGIRMVNVGKFVNTGDEVVPLQSIDPLYVNFSLAQNDLALVKKGQIVRVVMDAFKEEVFEGKITAINSQVDQSTRTINIQATVANPKHLLRPGMFVQVVVESDSEDTFLTLPVSAIAYAPYGNMVYVIEKMKDPNGVEYLGGRQQIVKLGVKKGDQVAVLTGLKAGEEVATSGTFKLRPGVAVVVNNTVQPDSSLNPAPEDQ